MWARYQSALPSLLAIVFALWFLYLLVKVAQHVGAWPFG